jgi:hypothetical protein
VSRHREKVLLASELDPGDIKTAEAHGGHMARRETHPRSAKAKAMGLASPTQLMPEPQARAEKKARNARYAAEAAAMHEHEEAADGSGGGGGKGGGRKRKAAVADDAKVGGGGGGSSSAAAAAAAPAAKKKKTPQRTK